MMLPKTTPTAFCQAFIERELESNKSKPIWMSYWPVMERMIDRADELSIVFDELIGKFGYSDKYENLYVWLTLEHIWMSSRFCKSGAIQARVAFKELNELQKTIVDLSERLAIALKRQDELYESSGFIQPDYQTVIDMIEDGSQNNHEYQWEVSEKLKALGGEYDLKYWPTRSDIVESIAFFEEIQPPPKHIEISENTLKGRTSDIKDFVLSFDKKFNDSNDLPCGFRFSNNALADIINVVLDLPVDKLTTGDAIRIIRYRYSR
ncbi:hypothetical protein GLP37_21565 [Photobacterium phosphoreum]|uniref:hypothetical protein n=1 Tax=Photobacterium phosphoreum TaxID=659 RepID=UPI001E43F1FC|nr:hypothetical protein [Photobacterium phosphoreum]MCD9504754.1 hypothetical protein [Photobacterium phosphoreum]